MKYHFIKIRTVQLNTTIVAVIVLKNVNRATEQNLFLAPSSGRRKKKMTLEQLNTALYEKLYAEQQEFVESLKNSTPENVIQNAYELVIREDILLSLEENDLDARQCKALLREKKPLDKLFLAWEKHEGDHMNEIRDCIENKANDLIKLARARTDRDSR